MLASAACTNPGASRVWITPPAPQQTIMAGFDRVLVAGVLADARRDVDINGEVSRFIRMTLRAKTSLLVIETDPLTLGPVLMTQRGESLAAAITPAAGHQEKHGKNSKDDAEKALVTNAPFWKKVGEEYDHPLILTGTVVFRPPTELKFNLVLISGRTGAVLDSSSLRAHVPSKRAHPPALPRLLQLLEQMTPSILTALGQRTSQVRVLLK